MPRQLSQCSSWAVDWTVCFWTSSRSKRLFCSLKHPVRLWGPPSILFSGYGGGGAFSLGIQQLGLGSDSSPPVLRVQMSGAVFVQTTYLHGADWGNFTLISWYRYRCKSNWRQCRHHGVVLYCFLASVSHQDRWPDWENISQYDPRHDWQACVSTGDNTVEVVKIWRGKLDWIHP